jgi:hypothetical protein
MDKLQLGGISNNDAFVVYLFFWCRFRNLTPGPLPFSSMNSTPANSNARRIAESFGAVIVAVPKFQHVESYAG